MNANSFDDFDTQIQIEELAPADLQEREEVSRLAVEPERTYFSCRSARPRPRYRWHGGIHGDVEPVCD